jgi:hypothetical protein
MLTQRSTGWVSTNDSSLLGSTRYYHATQPSDWMAIVSDVTTLTLTPASIVHDMDCTVFVSFTANVATPHHRLRTQGAAAIARCNNGGVNCSIFSIVVETGGRRLSFSRAQVPIRTHQLITNRYLLSARWLLKGMLNTTRLF